MCLFGGEIGWMDGKLWRENRKENFFECVWLGGKERK